MRGSGLRGGCSILTTAPEVDVRIWATGRVFYTDHSSGGGCKDLGYGAGVLVGEEVDGGQCTVDYHSQDKDDHQADLTTKMALLTQL